MELKLVKWPETGDMDHWKIYGPNDLWNYFPADTKEQLERTVTEFIIDVKYQGGEKITQDVKDSAKNEASKLVADELGV